MPWRSRISASLEVADDDAGLVGAAAQVGRDAVGGHDRVAPEGLARSTEARARVLHAARRGRRSRHRAAVLGLEDARPRARVHQDGRRRAVRRLDLRRWRRGSRRAGQSTGVVATVVVPMPGVFRMSERLIGAGARDERRLLEGDQALGEVGVTRPSTAGLESARSWLEIVARPAAVKTDAVTRGQRHARALGLRGKFGHPSGGGRETDLVELRSSSS